MDEHQSQRRDLHQPRQSTRSDGEKDGWAGGSGRRGGSSAARRIVSIAVFAVLEQHGRRACTSGSDSDSGSARLTLLLRLSRRLCRFLSACCPCVRRRSCQDGTRFWQLRECYIRGNTIKYLRIPDEVLDKVKEDVGAAGGGRDKTLQGAGGRGRGNQVQTHDGT